jgi:hypothetical protein
MGNSATFGLIHRAILKRQQLTFTYGAQPREACPYILGHKKGVETVLTFQFGGKSSRGLPVKGEWRCFQVAEMRRVEAREGRWHGDSEHRKAQRCVDDVFIDVNTDVPDQLGRH